MKDRLASASPLNLRKGKEGKDAGAEEEKSNFSSLAVASWDSLNNHVNDGMSSTLSHWKILAFGQGLSITMAGVGATSSELHLKCGLSAPTMLLLFTYLLLSLHFVPQLISHYWKKQGRFDFSISRRSSHISGINIDDERLPEDKNTEASKPLYTIPFTSFPLDCPWYKYFVVTLIDVEGFFFLVLACRYTTFTSITLLTALSIVGAMLTSRVLMKCEYSPYHFLGAAICFTGIIVDVISDLRDVDTNKEYPNKMWGDLFAAFGGLLYGINDGATEYLLKTCNQQQYLGVSGFFGIFISLFQMIIFDWENAKVFFNGSSTCEPSVVTILTIAFVITSYFKFVGDSYFLIVSEAALLNLSLLTVDFYSAIFQIFAEAIMPPYTFFLAFLLVATGVFIYESAPSPKSHPPTLEDNIKSGGFEVELPALT